MYKLTNRWKYKSQVLLSLILIFALALRLIFFSGLDSSDSLAYSEFAYKMAHGAIVLDEGHSAFRIGLIYPVSILYSVFGVNEVSSNIIILLLSLASIVLIYKIGKLLFNEKVGLLAAFLLSFFPLDVVYSTRLLTDLPSAFFVSLSIYFFLKSEKISKEGKKVRPNFYFIASGISLGIAYLMKELSLLIGLFFIAYAIKKRKIKPGYFLVAAGFILMFLLELLYFFKVTGNPFFRLSSFNSDWGASMVANNFFGTGKFPISILHHLYVMFMDNLLGLFFPLFFVAITYMIVNRKKETYDLLFWFVPVLIYMILGSASISAYLPFPAGARFFFIITTPGILLLSYFLSQNDKIIKRVLYPSIVVLLFITSIGHIYVSKERFTLKEIKEAYNYINSLPKKNIYADERTAMVLDFLSGYENTDNIKKFNIHPFLGSDLKFKNEFVPDFSETEDAYVIVNWKSINSLAEIEKGVTFPKQIYDIPKNWIPKKEFGSGPDRVEIYYIPSN